MRRTWAVLAALAGIVLIAGVGLLAADSSPAPEERPGASSLNDGGHGLSDLRALLEGAGHRVDELDETPSSASLDPDSTVILLDPGPIDGNEIDALRTFAGDGGRLVFGGDATLSAFTDLAGTPIDHDERGPDVATPYVPAPETVDVNSVTSAGDGSFADAGASLPLVGGADGESTVAVKTVGKGRLILVADPSTLENHLIGAADNAQLGLDLGGDSNRPVFFAERVRLSAASGLGALPTSWRIAFGGLVLAGLILIASRIRRTGPPESPSRELPPPRRRYVDAIGTALKRTGDPAAADVVRVAARRRLLAGSAASLEAEPAEIARVGAAAGLEPAEWEALTTPIGDEEQMLAAGSALAKLKETRR